MTFPPRAALALVCLCVFSSACSTPPPRGIDASADTRVDVQANDADASPATDARAPDAVVDASDANAIDVVPLRGFTVDPPADAGARGSGTAYTLLTSGDGGTAGDAGRVASDAAVPVIGSPCHTAADCSALGPLAACFASATGGFCTIDCTSDPESSTSCPLGTGCFTQLVVPSTSNRLCLQTCATDADCAGLGPTMKCSGSLTPFDLRLGLTPTLVCLPSCATDADCNTDVSGMICDVTQHRCDNPRNVLGSFCHTDTDCRGLGPAGVCMTSTRDPGAGYCTLGCDPSVPTPCPFGQLAPGDIGESLGPCVSNYATRSDGSPVAVCLGPCTADVSCQWASHNTCNWVPSLGASACTIACTTDADCFDGTCHVATGDCQDATFFSPACASNSDCADGICVTDFHSPTHHNCSRPCAVDADCPSSAVCVTSPVVVDGAGALTSVGFCAPSCTPDAGTCADPTTRCIAPVAHPEIDFSGSGAASGSFCWR